MREVTKNSLDRKPKKVYNIKVKMYPCLIVTANGYRSYARVKNKAGKLREVTMKKRLISLCLCLATLLMLLLTSCAEEEDVDSEIDKAEAQGTATLTMWVVSDEKVSEKSAALVSEAINDLTQTNYKVKMEILYFTEDEYYQKLSDAINAYTDTFVPSQTVVSSEEEEESYFDIYPALQENQVDILYIGDLHDKNGNLTISGADMYDELVEKGWLAPLNTYLNTGVAKKLREYIAPTLLTGAMKDGEIYAVPNNNVIGEYNYMLLNQELMDRYSMTGHFKNGDMTSFNNSYVYRYLDMIIADAASNTNILPIGATYSECLELLAHYWSVDPESLELSGDDFSLFGALQSEFGNLKNGLTAPGAESLFANSEFVADYLQLNKYRLNDSMTVYSDGKDSALTPALTFVKGEMIDLTVVDGVAYYDLNGTRYYAVPVEYPTATEEDIFGNMFGVCALNAKEAGRVQTCMEIITFFNTDDEARNLLQYGVEGEHYNISGGDPIRTELGAGYKMDLYATGNAFRAYPESWMDDDIWEYGKLQNRDASISTLSGFHLASYASSATAAADPFTVKSDKKYTLTYTTGHSKEILSQNDLLAAWIKSCDEKNEKSVYVYRTYVGDVNYITSTWYVYNTMGTGTIELQEKSIIEKEREIGVDITIAHTLTKQDGYTLSIVKTNVPTDYRGKIYTTVDGKDVGYATTTHKENFDFDLYNTDTYKVEVSSNLSIAHFYNNAELYQKLLAWKNETGKDQANYSVTWTSVVDGKTYQHFVIYRKNLTNATSAEILPLGTDKALSLAVNYTTYSAKVGKDYRDYALTYVRVEADKGVTVSDQIAYTLNAKTDSAKATAENSESDLKFTLAGALDIKLVEYISKLNKDVISILNSCTDYDSFKATVADLALLLDPTKEIVAEDLTVTAVKDYAASIDLVELRNNIRCYTSSELSDAALGLEDGEVIEELGESVVYYYSPFGIYTKWANETLPITKK